MDKRSGEKDFALLSLAISHSNRFGVAGSSVQNKPRCEGGKQNKVAAFWLCLGRSHLRDSAGL